ncbi:MAG: hypothetical protein JW709_10945 [Sedimentisphaerales bacterium]|nr:hypothetical protein [Sedimentisphaerales bacterium]
MTHAADNNQDLPSSLNEIRRTRDQAELLRDQLLAEFTLINEQENRLPPDIRDLPQRRQGRDAMHKAIKAVNHAIASIDQALRELQWAQTDDNP